MGMRQSGAGGMSVHFDAQKCFLTPPPINGALDTGCASRSPSGLHGTPPPPSFRVPMVTVAITLTTPATLCEAAQRSAGLLLPPACPAPATSRTTQSSQTGGLLFCLEGG